MPVEKSLIAYREMKRNCAQSILYGFQAILAIPDSEIEAARKLGGGRAEEGRCGALHAALQLSHNRQTIDQLRSAFENIAGSVYCREIRAKKQLSCEKCVELAAVILWQQDHAEKENIT